MIRLAALVAALLLTMGARAADVVLWHAYRSAEADALRQVAEVFHARTGHTVRLIEVSFGVFESKLETAVPRGNGPDLFIAAHGALGRWGPSGLVVPPGLSAQSHRPVTVDALTWDGRLMALPLAYKSAMLLYDPTLVTVPPTTTDELVEVARSFTGNGRYGLVYEAATPYYHAAWMHGFGGRVVEPGGGARLDTPEQIAALAFVAGLTEQGLLPPRPTAERVGSMYARGQAVFVISGPWFVADAERPIAAAPLPIVSATGQPARPYLTVEGVFLAHGSHEPEAARAFMAFLAGSDGARVRQDVGGQAVSLLEITSDDPLLVAQHAQARTAVPLPTDPDMDSAWEAMGRALRRTLRGAATPTVAATEAQAYYEVFSRPPPEPASPWPVIVMVGLGGVGAATWVGWRLRAVSLRAVFTHWRDYLWVAPATVALAVLVVLPFVLGALVAFYAHDNGQYTFVGLRNFVDILLSRDWPLTSPMSFAYTLAVTLLWTASNVALHVGIGVALAMVLREPWIRMRGLWRAALILPWAVPNYITALIWKTMFDAQYGAINHLLTLVTFSSEPVQLDWFGQFSTAFTANLVTNTWLGFPFMMVVTLGALQAIPRDLEEAAEVDGAGFWFRFRHVVWPLLMPALLPAIVLGSIWTFNMFNVVYLVSAGEPDGSTEILISDAYRWAFSRGHRYGYAAAYAVIIFGTLLLYSRLANRLAGRRVT